MVQLSDLARVAPSWRPPKCYLCSEPAPPCPIVIGLAFSLSVCCLKASCDGRDKSNGVATGRVSSGVRSRGSPSPYRKMGEKSTARAALASNAPVTQTPGHWYCAHAHEPRADPRAPPKK